MGAGEGASCPGGPALRGDTVSHDLWLFIRSFLGPPAVGLGRAAGGRLRGFPSRGAVVCLSPRASLQGPARPVHYSELSCELCLFMLIQGLSTNMQTGSQSQDSWGLENPRASRSRGHQSYLYFVSLETEAQGLFVPSPALP